MKILRAACHLHCNLYQPCDWSRACGTCEDDDVKISVLSPHEAMDTWGSHTTFAHYSLQSKLLEGANWQPVNTQSSFVSYTYQMHHALWKKTRGKVPKQNVLLTKRHLAIYYLGTWYRYSLKAQKLEFIMGYPGIISWIWRVLNSTLSSIFLQQLSAWNDEGHPGTVSIMTGLLLVPEQEGNMCLTCLATRPKKVANRKTLLSLHMGWLAA